MINENRLTRELIERLIAEGGGPTRLNFSGQNLSGLDLSYLDLSRADLSRADLRGTTFIQTRLRGAKLIEANLSQTELNDADLSAADLFQANLSGAFLARTLLRNSYLVDTDLRRARLTEARLSEADLRGANLAGADLSGADLSGVELSGLDLTEVILTTADRPLPLLQGANLYKARVTPAQFQLLAETEANLDGVEVVEEALPTPPPTPSPSTGPLRIKLRATNLGEVATSLTALNSLYLKSWLLTQGRLSDLAVWKEASTRHFEAVADLAITDLTFQAGQIGLILNPAQSAIQPVADALVRLKQVAVISSLAGFESALTVADELVTRLAPALSNQARTVIVQVFLPDLLQLNLI